MRVTALRLTNLRDIETAEFRLETGFNPTVRAKGHVPTSALRDLSSHAAAWEASRS
jgi:hypothetical protein